MTLTEALATPPAKLGILDTWVGTLNAEDRAAIIAAGIGADWPHTELLKVIVAHGGPRVGDTTIRSWRDKLRESR